MIECEKLIDYAARCLCPDDIEEGRRQLEAEIRKISWQTWLLSKADGFTLIMGIIVLIITLKYVNITQKFTLGLEFFLTIAGSVLVAWPVFGKREFENRKKLFTGKRRYAGHLPAPLETLLDELASGSVHTRRKLKAGEQDGGAVNTSTGEVLSSLIPTDIYLNRYALLLMASDSKMYKYVWPRRLFSATISSTLYVAWENADTKLEQAASQLKDVTSRLEQTADINAASSDRIATSSDQLNSMVASGEELKQTADMLKQHEETLGDTTKLLTDTTNQVTLNAKKIYTAALAFAKTWDISDAQENKNHNLADAWLVEGTDEEFALGEAAFLKGEFGSKKNPYLENVYKIILWEGRRQLQKGALHGDDATVVRRILIKLKKLPASPTGSHGDQKTILSGSTITNLLAGYRQGTNGRRDITGYFLRNRKPKQ